MSSISVSLYSNGRMIIIKISCCSQCQQKLIYWQKIHGRTQRLIKLFTLQPFCNIVSLISVYHLCLSFRQYCMPQQVSAWWQSPLKAGVIPRKCTGFPFVQFKRLVRGGSDYEPYRGWMVISENWCICQTWHVCGALILATMVK